MIVDSHQHFWALELNGTYDLWRRAALTIVGKRPGKAAIFGGTAAKFYRL